MIDLFALDQDANIFMRSIFKPISKHEIDKIKISNFIPDNLWMIDEIARTIYISPFMYQKLVNTIPDDLWSKSSVDLPDGMMGRIYGIPIVSGSMNTESKWICPECLDKFKSIGFGFEVLATSFPDIDKSCRFCGEIGRWKSHMVTCIPVMFMKVI